MVTFLAVFCREKPTPIGSWRSVQRRSYFAAKLTEDWWLWGIDIALVYDMDQPQADYFVNITAAMKPGSKVILCCSEPGWYQADNEGMSYRTLGYALWLIAKRKDIQIPLVLSGDSHHYARYASETTGANYITSGGGGVYVTGTIDLNPKMKLKKFPKEPELSLKTSYPTPANSKKLLNGNFSFFPMNVGFSYFLGIAYIIFAFVLTYAPQVDVALGIWTAFFLAFLGYLKRQETASFLKLTAVAALHAIPHTAIVLILAWIVLTLDAQLSISVQQLHWSAWLAFILLWLPAVACLGGVVYGLHLWITAHFFGLNQNDAFSAIRLDSHRHFLRIRILDDTATVYPVKLDIVPSRHEWRLNPERDTDKSKSVFIADPPLQADLIEKPIVIQLKPQQ